jgi:hypothetical protein
MDSPPTAPVSKHRPGFFTPKIKFTPQEDEMLRELVGRFGATDWRRVASHLSTRNSRQCRERWKNYLDPLVAHSQEWTDDDDALLESVFADVGSRWTTLASYFPGRSTNSVKNRWIALQRRKRRRARARRQAIDRSDDDRETDEDAAPEVPRCEDPLAFLSSVKNAIDVVFELFSDQKDASEWF